MKGFISTTLATVCLAGLAAGAQGAGFPNLYDPCWPQRYNCTARHEVHACFDPQVANGHILDQTIWNWQFEPGKDTLTPAGLDHLAYLARRRPFPDTKLYLQTAQDIAYDPAAPEKLVGARVDLDHKRIAAIERYLNAQTAGRPLTFEVSVHDPAEVGMSAVPIGTQPPPPGQLGVVWQMYGSFRGLLPVTAGAGVAGR